MALADDQEQYRAVAEVFEQLRAEERRLEAELGQIQKEAAPDPDLEAEVEAAMASLDEIELLAADPDNLGAVGELFRKLNARLFLSFREEQPKERVINRVVAGVLTFGSTPPPVPLYEGPTGRGDLKIRSADCGDIQAAISPARPAPSGGQEDSSRGIVSRGERI